MLLVVENVQTEMVENGEADEDEKEILSYKGRLTSLFQLQACLLLPMYCNNDQILSIVNESAIPRLPGLEHKRTVGKKHRNFEPYSQKLIEQNTRPPPLRSWGLTSC